MASSQGGRARPRREGSRLGLAVAAGGPLGGIYEVGAMLALDEALAGIDFNDLHAYVGVSAGALIAAGLANKVSTGQIARIFITSESLAHPFRPRTFFRPAYGEFLKRLSEGPTAIAGSVVRLLKDPRQFRLLDAFTSWSRAIPNGLFDNDALHEILAEVFSTRGRTNDFRKLDHNLFIIAVDIDSGRTVVFGTDGYDHVPISKACQASAAMPGLYPPVAIDDRYYVDGALKTTMHASRALEAGADMVIGINPIVPFELTLVADGEDRLKRLADGGLPLVLSQTVRAIIHSRMTASMRRYSDHYPDKDVVLFEPDPDDSRMFFSNPFSYANRKELCQHAYERTRNDLWNRREELERVFSRHGIRLRTGILRQRGRHFTQAMSVPLEVRELSRLRNQVTNELSGTLDRLEDVLERYAPTATDRA